MDDFTRKFDLASEKDAEIHEILSTVYRALEEKGYNGKTVTLGIRPEDLHDDEAYLAASPKSVIDATIRVYEMLGAEVYLYFDVNEANCTARVNPRTSARPGDTVKLALDLSKIHVFDKDTEQVIVN